MKNKHQTQTSRRFNSSEFYFDDCPICRAMAKAEKEGRALSEVELAETFAQAGKQGGVVGAIQPVSAKKGDE